jgi:Icc-related predicted phosphoesterase
LVGESDRIHVLINQSISLFDLKIFGSPYSIRYEDWVFMKSGEALFAEWDKIPKDVEILITHSPPYGVLDYQPSAGHLGCNNLMYRIEHEFKKLILHGFGHVHESNGVREKDNKLFLNSAIMGSEYSGPFNSWLLNWEDKKIVNYERLED